MNTLKQVEEVVEKLREKHGTNYSVEKLNAWAHLNHMEKHSSYIEPPNPLYFGKRHQASSSAAANVSVTCSPVKRVRFCTNVSTG